MKPHKEGGKKGRFSLGAVWNKYIKNRFFSKVFLAFFSITVCAGGALLMVLSENLVTIKTEQSLEMSSQIIDTVDGYLNDKLTEARSIQLHFIRDSTNWDLLCSLLKGEQTAPVEAGFYARMRQTIAQAIYAIDNQFYGLFFYGRKSGSLMRFSNEPEPNDAAFFSAWASETEHPNNWYLIAGAPPKNGRNAFSLFVARTITDPKMFTQKIGMMGLSFSAMNVRQSYRRLEAYLKGPLLVMDKNGALLYDSGADYEPPKGFSQGEVLAIENGSKRVGGSLYNVRYNPLGEYYVVNLIPMEEIWRDVAVVRSSLLLVIAAVLLAALLLIFYSSRKFSHRLNRLTDTMEQVRGGKLTNFAAVKQADEIGAIHAEFISVCSSLDAHIQKEYVYQLRQKEMEVYALQAQIDPHFLYNSLETIRMKLVMAGDSEASRMIRILAEIFRNIMKQDMVVGVREEISYLKSYLELYKFRLGDRLEYKLEIDDAVYNYATIKHVLQPIVENCLLHGFRDIAGSDAPGRILVAAWLDEGDVMFIVRDNGQGIPEEQLAEMKQKLCSDEFFQKTVGVFNVNNRLRIIYGDAYRLQLESNASGTEVGLRIKAMTKKELEGYVQSAGG